MWGVYKVQKNGKHVYVSRSATQSKKLASEIAADLSAGQITMPDGSIRQVKPHPHVAKKIEESFK